MCFRRGRPVGLFKTVVASFIGEADHFFVAFAVAVGYEGVFAALRECL